MSTPRRRRMRRGSIVVLFFIIFFSVYFSSVDFVRALSGNSDTFYPGDCVEGESLRAKLHYTEIA